MKISFAVFAHNEEESLPNLLRDLSKQNIFFTSEFNAHLDILANGCSDATVKIAKSTLTTLPPRFAERVEIRDLAQSGKSRTAHRFIHNFTSPNDDLLGFMDADIRLPDPETLFKMAGELRDRPKLVVTTSRPVKDISFGDPVKGFTSRLIGSGADGLTDWKKSICGQLFIARADAIRRIGLPVGLPVEDGFFRALLLTNLLANPEDLSLIDGRDDVFHVYASIRDLQELVRHQARIVIGSAINSAVYRKIRMETASEHEAHNLLMQAAADEEWLPKVIRHELPRFPYGYIPFNLVTKRWRKYRQRKNYDPKSTLTLFLGTGLDSLVWVLASYKMHKGTGAGHW